MLAHPILCHEAYRFIPILWPRFRPAIQAGPVTIRKINWPYAAGALGKEFFGFRNNFAMASFPEGFSKIHSIQPKIAFNSYVNAGSKFFSRCESGIGIVIMLASLFYSSLQRGDSCFAESFLYTTKRLSFFLILYNDRTCLDGRPEAGP
jgi:hypothetical protein